ncbi:MAG TPA: hypothetical protein IGS52_23475 [Oscillatoriaceae cyanobacterium M33_DOE_052]|uniref:Uncharacterized protein n=1 Tax=Planktothricoides sp. SpSt-374 TaxID=2282167 RepID=A0A7C3ZQE6_9CYAN|nr:hypothetical protein [Oscillatoriaceae cyanobacterium M33_DOE_052]
MKAHFQAAPTADDRLSAKIRDCAELLPNSMQEACANPEICQMVMAEIRLGEMDIFHAIWRVVNQRSPESISPSVWFG